MTATAKSTFEAGEDGDLGFEKGETIVVRASDILLPRCAVLF